MLHTAHIYCAVLRGVDCLFVLVMGQEQTYQDPNEINQIYFEAVLRGKTKIAVRVGVGDKWIFRLAPPLYEFCVSVCL